MQNLPSLIQLIQNVQNNSLTGNTPLKARVSGYLKSDEGTKDLDQFMEEVYCNLTLTDIESIKKTLMCLIVRVVDENPDLITRNLSSILTNPPKPFSHLVKTLDRHFDDPQISLSNWVVMGDPYGAKDVDILGIVGNDDRPLNHLKHRVDMIRFRRDFDVWCFTYLKCRLPTIPINLSLARLNEKGEIAECTAGTPATTTSMVALTQMYYPSTSQGYLPFKNSLDGNKEIFPMATYLLLWIAQKMKFLLPHLYNTSIPNCDGRTFRQYLQGRDKDGNPAEHIYDNYKARVDFGRETILPLLIDYISSLGKDCFSTSAASSSSHHPDVSYDRMKALAWKLGQILCFQHDHYPHTRTKLRDSLNTLFPDFDGDLGSGVIWWMCEGGTRKLSPLCVDDCLPAILDPVFHPQALPFLLNAFKDWSEKNLTKLYIQSQMDIIYNTN